MVFPKETYFMKLLSEVLTKKPSLHCSKMETFKKRPTLYYHKTGFSKRNPMCTTIQWGFSKIDLPYNADDAFKKQELLYIYRKKKFSRKRPTLHCS